MKPPPPAAPPLPPVDLVVGLGASAGGIEALEAFFAGLPASDGLAFVVVLHLDPGHESRLAEVLQQTTPLPVVQVRGAVDIAPGRVYVIPPGRNLCAREGQLLLEPRATERERRAPIDHFFRTLAEAHGPRALGVVLSGTGADGSAGVGQLRETGGAVFVQDPADALFDEMPRHAVASAEADVVAPAHALGAEVVAYAGRRRRVRLAEEPLSDDRVRALHDVLALLHARTGHDFAPYKRGTVLRRLDRRLHLTGTPSLDAYLARLEQDPDEPAALLADLLISVTNFFRDPPAWEVLARRVVPALFAEAQAAGGPGEVRVWVPACATGEEAYSVTILLLEHAAGLDDPPPIQVFATDLSEAAVQTAREGTYAPSIAADVSPERLAQFFAAESGRYRVRERVREHVVFAAHDLLTNPPFSRLGLVCCRNLLIYFQRELQRRALGLFHFALSPGGRLLLGTSETAESAGALFRVLDKDAHLYVRRDVPTPALLLPRRGGLPSASAPSASAPSAPDPAALHQALRAEAAPPSVLVAENDDVLHVAPSALPFLALAGGVPTQQLSALVRPELRADVRLALSRARQARGPAERPAVEIAFEGGARRVRVRAQPAGPDGLAQVFFLDAPGAGGAGTEEAPDRVRVLEGDLRLARETLQNTAERFETGQEELMTQNERLQSTNEELRSTTEEIETSREEAQSMTEELRTMNAELRAKVDQVSRTQADVENLIVSTEIAVLFLDRALRIRRFTPRVREHFHVLASDLGRPLADLAQKFSHVHLLDDAQAVLDTLEVREREVMNEAGQWFLVHVRPYREPDDRVAGVVVTFVDITERKRAQIALAASEERYRTLFASIDEGFCVIEVLFGEDGEPEDYRYLEANPAFERQSGMQDVVGRTIRELVPGIEAYWISLFGNVAQTGEPVRALDRTEALGRWFDVHASRTGPPEARHVGVLFKDVTEAREAEAALAQSEERFRRTAETVLDILFTADAEGRVDYVNARFEEVTGRPRAEALGTPLWPDLLHPEDRTHGVWTDGLDTREPYATRHRLRLADGSYAWHLTRARAFCSGEGQPARWHGTSTDIDALVRAEHAVRTLNQTLEGRVAERTEQVQALTAYLVEAEERERKRLALVLHDDLQQQLFGLSVALSLLREAASPEEHEASLAQAEGIVTRAKALTRSLANELDPQVLESERIADLLGWLAERKQDQHGLTLEVDVEEPCLVYARSVRTLLYHALGEVLLNVVKHAGVSRAALRARCVGAEVRVTVEDAGAGFDPDALEHRAEGGLGLYSVRERLEMVGGRLEVASVPGQGTRTTLAVPIGEPDAAPDGANPERAPEGD